MLIQCIPLIDAMGMVIIMAANAANVAFKRSLIRVEKRIEIAAVASVPITAYKSPILRRCILTVNGMPFERIGRRYVEITMLIIKNENTTITFDSKIVFLATGRENRKILLFRSVSPAIAPIDIMIPKNIANCHKFLPNHWEKIKKSIYLRFGSIAVNWFITHPGTAGLSSSSGEIFKVIL